MTSEINVAIPQELAFALKMQEPELAREILRLSVVKLYELGKLSSGLAAQFLGITRLSFLELAAEYQVSILGNPNPTSTRLAECVRLCKMFFQLPENNFKL